MKINSFILVKLLAWGISREMNLKFIILPFEQGLYTVQKNEGWGYPLNDREKPGA